MSGTIFIAGVHGVGKSTAASLISQRFNIPAYTASEIIKSASTSNIALSSSNKLVNDVDKNQQLLIHGIKKILNKNLSLILDGHFTLINSSQNIVKIGIEIFEKLSLSKIILLIEDPNIIYERLMSRDKYSFSIDVIRRHQELEEAQANYISTTLSIPIYKILSWNEETLYTGFK